MPGRIDWRATIFHRALVTFSLRPGYFTPRIAALWRERGVDKSISDFADDYAKFLDEPAFTLKAAPIAEGRRHFFIHDGRLIILDVFHSIASREKASPRAAIYCHKISLPAFRIGKVADVGILICRQ